MSNEIERKFLVKPGVDFESLGDTFEITQGYLSSVKERTVRVRIMGNKAFLTIKGIVSSSGMTRYEFEKEISLSEARELLLLCEKPLLSKKRTNIKAGNHIFEVDRFLLENEGLVVAEIELNHENEEFEKPDWLGREVTGDSKYYNSNLIKNPYKNWES